MTFPCNLDWKLSFGIRSCFILKISRAAKGCKGHHVLTCIIPTCQCDHFKLLIICIRHHDATIANYINYRNASSLFGIGQMWYIIASSAINTSCPRSVYYVIVICNGHYICSRIWYLKELNLNITKCTVLYWISNLLQNKYSLTSLTSWRSIPYFWYGICDMLWAYICARVVEWLIVLIVKYNVIIIFYKYHKFIHVRKHIFLKTAWHHKKKSSIGSKSHSHLIRNWELTASLTSG